MLVSFMMKLNGVAVQTLYERYQIQSGRVLIYGTHLSTVYTYREEVVHGTLSGL